MVNLVLDTSILHEGLWSKDMYQLTNLINAGYVTLYIPKFVEREYTTHVLSYVEKQVDNNSNLAINLRKLKRVKPKQKSFLHVNRNNDILDKLESFNNSLVSEMQKVISTDYEDWKNLNKVKIIEFDYTLFESIEDDYFSGCGVFSSVKNRRDIPDAVIYECVKSLTQRVGEVSFILMDKKFRCKAEGKLINVFASLREFYSGKKVMAITEKLLLGKGLEETISKLTSSEFEHAIQNYYKVSVDVENIRVDSISTDVKPISLGSNENIHFIHDLSLKSMTGFSFNSNPVILSDKYIFDVDFTCEAKIRRSVPLSYMDEYYENEIISTKSGLCEVDREGVIRFQTEIYIPIEAFDIDSFEPTDNDSFLLSASFGLGDKANIKLDAKTGIVINAKRCKIIEDHVENSEDFEDHTDTH